MSFGLGEFYSVACAVVWAASVILFKKSGESLPPVALNLFKNLLGLVLMAVTALAFSGAAVAMPADAVLLALLSGFLGIGIGDTLYFRALNALGASRMGIAQTAYSPFVILLSTGLLGERLLLLQVVGVALVIFGILLVNYTPAADRGVAALRAALVTAVVSVFAMAIGVVIAKPLLERYDFLWTVTLRIVGGMGGLLIGVLWLRRGARVLGSFRGVRHWPHIIAGSVLGTYVSMMLWLAGYKYTQASIAAVLNELAAVFIVAMAAIFLRERLRPRQLAGSVTALAGVMLVVTKL